MNELVGQAWTLGAPVVLIVFVVVFVVCLRVLPEMGFGGFSARVLAFCVAALSAMGLIMLEPERGSREVSESVPLPESFLLMPYATLGLTLLLLPLILFVCKCFYAFRESVRLDRKMPQTRGDFSSQDSTRLASHGCGRIERRTDEGRIETK